MPTPEYRAKALGGNRFALYDQTMEAAAGERLVLENDLRHAIFREELELLYQPVVDLATRRIVGCEALVRWNHRVRGVVAPGVFIPIAEESGAIVVVDRWVLREACATAARVRAYQPEFGGGQLLAARPARARPSRCRGGDAGRTRSARRRALGGSHRARAARRYRAAGAAAGPARSACRSRSTTSGSATARSPSSSACRSPRSRSTERSSATSPMTPTTKRSSVRSSRSRRRSACTSPPKAWKPSSSCVRRVARLRRGPRISLRRADERRALDECLPRAPALAAGARRVNKPPDPRIDAARNVRYHQVAKGRCDPVSIVWRVEDQAEQVLRQRGAFRACLVALEKPPADVDAAELIYGELVANTVRYAAGAVEVHLERAAASARSWSCAITARVSACVPGSRGATCSPSPAAGSGSSSCSPSRCRRRRRRRRHGDSRDPPLRRRANHPPIWY